MKQLSPSIWRLGAFLLVVIVMAVALIIPADLAALLHLNMGLPGTNSAHAAAACASPPAGFNPATATAAAIASYGLPRRPATTSPKYQHWLKIVKTAKKRTCTIKKRSHGTSITYKKTTRTAAVAQTTSATWAGYELDAGSSTLTDVSGSTVLSCNVPNNGADNNTLITFTQLGNVVVGATSDSIDAYAFVTSTNDGTDFQIYDGQLTCGDTIAFDIQQSGGSYDLVASDATSGVYQGITVSGSANPYDAYWGITGDPSAPSESLETLNGAPLPITSCTFAIGNGPIASLGTGYISAVELLSQNAAGTPVDRTVVGPLTNGAGTDFTITVKSST